MLSIQFRLTSAHIICLMTPALAMGGVQHRPHGRVSSAQLRASVTAIYEYFAAYDYSSDLDQKAVRAMLVLGSEPSLARICTTVERGISRIPLNRNGGRYVGPFTIEVPLVNVLFDFGDKYPEPFLEHKGGLHLDRMASFTGYWGPSFKEIVKYYAKVHRRKDLSPFFKAVLGFAR